MAIPAAVAGSGRPKAVHRHGESVTIATAYSVAAFNVDPQVNVTITGTLPEVQSGKQLRLCGEWTEQERYDWRFRVIPSSTSFPLIRTGWRAFSGQR